MTSYMRHDGATANMFFSLNYCFFLVLVLRFVPWSSSWNSKKSRSRTFGNRKGMKTNNRVCLYPLPFFRMLRFEEPQYCILAWICIYRIYISMKAIKLLICLFNGSHVATVRKVANNTGHGTIQIEVRSCNQYGTEVVHYSLSLQPRLLCLSIYWG